MKIYLLLFGLVLTSLFSSAQSDMEVTLIPTWTNPLSGCDTGDPNDTMRVFIRNNGPQPTAFGQKTYISFSINGGPFVVDSIPASIGVLGIWQFTFTNVYPDLSACDDTFDIVTTVSYFNDPDNSNDTFAYQFINSCTITPGDITGGTTVCQSGNSGTLYHGNYLNGWVQDWEYYNAVSGGWASATNPLLDSLNYWNVQYETYYRVIRTSAYCPNDTSTMDTIFVDSVSIAGTTSGSNTVCTGTNAGWIASNGVFGNIDDWEYNDGGGWMSMGVADSVQYNNLTQQTIYRYFVTNGVCPQDTSDTAVVVIDQLTIPGTLLQDDTLCSGPNSDTLFLSGNNGTILDWLIDSTGTWTSLGVTDTFLVISNMTTDSDFQVVIQNGVCPADSSNSITMVIQNAPVITICPDTTIAIGDSAQLYATGGAAWVWSPGLTLDDSLSQTPLAGPIVQTDYVYYAMSTNGCMNWDTVTVFLVPPVPDEDSIIITNMITANGDGINDTWAITDVNSLVGTQVKIWNVYGQEIYSSDSYQNDWDGTYNGNRLPNGTYYYWVRLGVYDSERKGTITIVGDE